MLKNRTPKTLPDSTALAPSIDINNLPIRDALHFPISQAQSIDPYLPSLSSTLTPVSTNTSTTTSPESPKPCVTLTFATSLDSNLSLSPGVQTVLSGPQSKAMTHYLRSHHDAILIGCGTAIADDPSLNCRIAGVGGYGNEGLEGQPRPVVVDPNGRWNVNDRSKVINLAKEGKGRGVWIVSKKGSSNQDRRGVVESVGGKVLELSTGKDGSMNWKEILEVLAKEGIKSVMIEGGGAVINELLSKENMALVDSVIVTIAPVWLGKGGVQVCPDATTEEGQRVPVRRLQDVKWVPLGDDVILCGRPVLSQA
jgi:2,5-diamino-6-(ribosylamino)-4(3H)-pyrimidinone 5'-phosphate reductase